MLHYSVFSFYELLLPSPASVPMFVYFGALSARPYFLSSRIIEFLPVSYFIAKQPSR